MSNMDKKIKDAIKSWDDRLKNIVEAVKAVADLSDSGMSNHSIALALGARHGEIVLYQDLASLNPVVLKLIIEKHLPIGLATYLANESEESQINALNMFLKNDFYALEDPYIKLESVIRNLATNKGATVKTLTGKHLMHLATKAKEYNALSNQGRRALFTIGKQMRFGISQKQQRYADTLLKQLKDAGILTASCGKDNCNICKDIFNLIEVS